MARIHANENFPFPVGDFSLISTELEMIRHSNPTRQRGFREP